MISNSNITLSVVIVSYNVREFVLEAISSVYNLSAVSVQVVVIDNHSTDGTVEAIKTQFSEVSIIANQHNVGFSAANNQGFAICKGKYVLMLNPDAALVDDSILKMIKYIEDSKQTYLLLGPKLMNTDGSLQVSCWKFPSPLQHVLELFFLNKIIDTTKYHPSFLKQEKAVDFLSGACILMKASTLNALGGLDVNLFWMDDVDLCKRNKLMGGENQYFPMAIVKHHIGQSSKKNQRVVISNQIISKLKFYKKHKQFFYFFISVFIFFLQIISRIPLFFIIGIIKKKYIIKANAYFYTLIQFFNYVFLGKQNLT